MSFAVTSVPLTPADGVVILIVVADVYLGVRRGVPGQLSKLVSMLIAVAAGVLLLRPLGSMCYYYCAGPLAGEPHCYTFAFVTTVVAATAVRLVVQPFLHSWFDRTAPQYRHRVLGGLVGMVHAAIGIVVFIVMMNLWTPSGADNFFGSDSFVGRNVKRVIPEIKARLSARGTVDAPLALPAPARGSGGKMSVIDALRERKHTPGGE